MTTRNLIALGTMLAVMSLAGTGFAADQKAAGTTAPAATAAPAPDAGTPAKPAKKKKKHSTGSSSSSSGASTTPAPKN